MVPDDEEVDVLRAVMCREHCQRCTVCILQMERSVDAMYSFHTFQLDPGQVSVLDRFAPLNFGRDIKRSQIGAREPVIFT